MIDIRRFQNGLQIIPNAVGNIAPSIEGEMAVWDTSVGIASFSGTIIGTSTAVVLTANNTGASGNAIILSFTLTRASATDTLDSPNIIFTATTPGTIGNSISLVFNGTSTVSTVTTAWNIANPSNTVTFTGSGSVVPTAQTINLSGGVQTSITSAISTWNIANPSNQVTLTSGDGTQTPSTQLLELSGAGDGNIWYNNGLVAPYPITAALTALTGDVITAPGPGSVHATVEFVGGVSAAAIAAAVFSTQSGTPLDTPNTLVLRDNAGSFAATNITANLLGNATTATLAGNITGLLSPFNGGTGVSNANSSTITIANPFPITLTYPAATNVTLPITGTLATLIGTETFANKRFSNQQTWNEITTPVVLPPSGTIDIYAKSDNNVYVLTSGGLESPLNGGANPVGSITMFGGTSNASFVGTIPGTQTSVSLAADNPGQAGNGITLVFNGVEAGAVDTIDTPNITFSANYNGTIGNSISLVFDGVAATVTDTVDSPNIIFTADFAGAAGNSISLVFNGTSTVQSVVNAWNTGNPGNTVHFSGFGTVIPAANTWTLSGGSGTTINTIVGNWNISNVSNTVSYTGAPTVIPFAQTVNLSGGSGVSINTAITNWNLANPSNTASLVSGDGTQVPDTGAPAVFSGATIPAGWLLCDGSARNRALFANLFATIGFNFGQGAPATQSVAHLTTVADVSSAAFANIGTNTITAVNLGLIGNSISLSFDGVMTVSQVVFNWNTLNPSNQVTQVGNGANVYPAQTLNLSNGTSTTDGKYFEIYDDVGLVIAWIKIASTTPAPVVGGATRYIQLNGVTTGDPAPAIASAIATDLAGDASFTPTTSTSNIVIITNTSFITHPAGNAGNTPFTYQQIDAGGLSTFNLPDFRGLFPRGVDPTGVNDPDFAARTAVNSGNSGGKVGSFQADGLVEHEHLIRLFGNPGFGGVGEFVSPTGQFASTIAISSISGTATVTTENRPKNLYINYIIKF